MNIDLRPFVGIWILLAATVIALFVWRKIVAGKEDDTIHVNSGGPAVDQTVIAHKLEVIDKWGKIFTVIAVIVGLLIAAAYVYGQFVGRPSMGA